MSLKEDKESNTTESQALSDKSSALTPQGHGRLKKLYCPKCDSSRIRKRSLYLFISLAAFAGLWVLKMVATALASSIIESSFAVGLGLTLLAIFLFWPAVIAGAACFAFIGRHHCLSCGYRFRSIHEKEQIKNEASFPWSFSIINGIIIFIVLSLSGNIYTLLSHFSTSMIFSMILIEAIFVAFPAAFLIGISLSYQAIIYRLFRTRIRSTLLWAILFLLPAIALSGDLFYRHLPKVAANRILAHGELAPLPESATDIKVYTWSSPMSGEEFLRFSATPDDIEVFLNTSPILKRAECKKYSKDKMRLPYSKDYFNKFEKHYNDSHEYFSPERDAPEWYIEELRGVGRRYTIHPKGYHYPGEVIINDEKNLVFVSLCFS
jgi:hypothetical protein